MSSALNTSKGDARPLFWYGLPHGFQQLDLEPSSERIEEVRRTLDGLEGDADRRAQEGLRFHLGLMEALRGRGVHSAAVGMHPDEVGGASFSILTASSVQTGAANPKAVLAGMLESAPAESGVRPLDLPVGPAFFMESVQLRRAPGHPADEEGPHTQGKVWEGSVVIPETKSSAVITLQLSTAALGAAQDYRQILIAIAHTLSFTDPESAARDTGDAPAAAPSSIAQNIIDDFG